MSPPATLHHTTKGLFTAVPFTQYLTPGYPRKKLQDIPKGYLTSQCVSLLIYKMGIIIVFFIEFSLALYVLIYVKRA